MTHSNFFDDLSKRGHILTYYSSDITLKKFGEYLFDNIVLISPKYNEFNTVSIEDLHDFVDDGGNLLFIADNQISDKMRLFAATCGVEFDRKGSTVIDHVHFEQSVDNRFFSFINLFSNYILHAMF